MECYLYAGVYFLLRKCPLSFSFRAMMWMLIIQQPVTLFILPLCLSLSHTSSPICLQILSSRPLRLSHSHCLTVLFFLTLQEMSAPAVVLTIWYGNERKWEFICFRRSEGREESNISNPRTGKQRILAISAGWGEITTNEHMDCSTMKLSCSHAAIKQKTVISVAISSGKEFGESVLCALLLLNTDPHTGTWSALHTHLTPTPR